MIVATAPKLCQKCDFCLKERMKETFAYVLEIMLNLAKMLDLAPNCLQKYQQTTLIGKWLKMLR